MPKAPSPWLMRKYPIILFIMAKIMEMNNNQQNQVAMYLYNNIEI